MSIWRILFGLGVNHGYESGKAKEHSARSPSIARSASVADWENALESIDFASAQMAASSSQEQGARIYVIHVRRPRLVEILKRWRDNGYQLRLVGGRWKARKHA